MWMFPRGSSATQCALPSESPERPVVLDRRASGVQEASEQSGGVRRSSTRARNDKAADFILYTPHP
ncbi:MAG: hypothetical protein JSW03_10210 [Candidatus Eiseniibacteriota bacterium]|nr:MAG: hypothetical protein JSW03_10210 [Candidatus Eisenbacteria bacterium]